MVVTALNRRAFCFAILPLAAAPDDHTDRTDVTEMFGAFAASLSEENPLAAMKWVDPAMPGRETLQRVLVSLVEKYEVSTAISMLSMDVPEVRLDWFLELKLRGSTEPVERRRMNIRCEVEKKKNGWRIKKMEPVSFFQ